MCLLQQVRVRNLSNKFLQNLNLYDIELKISKNRNNIRYLNIEVYYIVYLPSLSQCIRYLYISSVKWKEKQSVFFLFSLKVLIEFPNFRLDDLKIGYSRHFK